MAWHLFDGREDDLIIDALVAQRVNELLAQAFVAVVVSQVGVHFSQLWREITANLTIKELFLLKFFKLVLEFVEVPTV